MGLKIGEIAKATGTNVETVRYYERINLLQPAERTSGNYRTYTPADVARLNFIRHARGLGFNIPDIRSLLDLSDEPERDCSDVDRIASGHLALVEAKLAQLSTLRDELSRVVGECRGGQVGSCRIMEVLADHGECSNDHTITSHTADVTRAQKGQTGGESRTLARGIGSGS